MDKGHLRDIIGQLIDEIAEGDDSVERTLWVYLAKNALTCAVADRESLERSSALLDIHIHLKALRITP